MESGTFVGEGHSDHTVSMASLRVLAPPMRLVSAAMWQVMQRKDVLHYGKLEEFVSSISEMVPGLLSYRHRAKLTLGLQARMIMELCRTQDPPDPPSILRHLERIQTPPCQGERDEKVETAACSFKLLVRSLLESPAQRQDFFQVEFVVEYGPQFDMALEKLFWEFLSRLDQLLPVPDLAQTVSWLSAAPSVQEECVQAVSQPQLLHILLRHQKLLGHLGTYALPSSMGDSILSSLSLPPSGRVLCTKPTTADPFGQSGTSVKLSASHKQGKSSPITPVIGLLTSQNLPLTASCATGVGNALATPTDGMEAESGASVVSEGRGGASTPLDDEKAETVTGKASPPDRVRQERLSLSAGLEPKGLPKQSRQEGEASLDQQDEKSMRRRVSERLRRRERESAREEKCGGQDAGQTLQIGQEVAGLSPVLTSCLKRQPWVLLHRLSTDTLPGLERPHCQGNGIQSPQRRLLVVTEATRSPQRQSPVVTEGTSCRRRGRGVKRKLSASVAPQKQPSYSSEKENCVTLPISLGLSPVIALRSHSRGRKSITPAGDDDIIIDSEDEEISHVRGRLFVEQYYRTKHNTFVPTLREYCGSSLA
ncbi:hypothetical protein JZ751_022528 [Albula glossodonta]|uniref:TERF1-interacting nuclear factor 2 N-terminal domain-containing protein n=1 Tax=Albula glossodonta TaxID=121402 RepID=A0A8T2MYD5_9TELE|nr:hypothetical protein JZ751_022528 [Albula glossodonta]